MSAKPTGTSCRASLGFWFFASKSSSPFFHVVLDCKPEAFFKRQLGLEAEPLARTGAVEQPPRLAVRPARVPRELARVANLLCDQACKRAYRNFLSAADVDWLRAIVFFRSQHDCARAVVHVEELASGLSSAPEHDLALPAFLCLCKLVYHGRDYVRGYVVEVVARAVEVDRYEVDAIEAELPPVGLQLHEHHLLR